MGSNPISRTNIGEIEMTKYRIYGKNQIEINTDPQRRCYNGCHFSSEWVWTDWVHLGTVFLKKMQKNLLLFGEN